MSKKMKCFICGKDEKIVNDKVVKRFCCDCLTNGKYLRYKINESRKERLEELNK